MKTDDDIIRLGLQMNEKDYGKFMRKEFKHYMDRPDDYLDAATYMMNRFGIHPYRESALIPLAKVIDTVESDDGIAFSLQPIKVPVFNTQTNDLNWYTYYKEKENKPMKQCDIDFEKKKVDLKKEMDQALFDLQTKWEEDKIQIRSEYNQKLLDLEKEKHEAEIKEESDEQAKALKALYDSYIAAGFTKTDAKEFVTLELKSDER